MATSTCVGPGAKSNRAARENEKPKTGHTETSPGKPQTNTQTLPAMVESGTACLENGDLSGALHAYEQVVNSFPERPEGHNNLGALYTSLGEHERAEACFSRVIDILPDNPSIYYNRGMARSNQEKFDAARADFQQVLAFDSQDTDSLNNLGVMDFMQGKFNAARSHFQEALAINPDYPRALLNLCDVAKAEGKSAEAVEICEKFLQVHNSTEVRRALFEMLSDGCRTALDKAGRTAEILLAGGAADPEISRERDRLQKAKAVLEEKPGI